MSTTSISEFERTKPVQTMKAINDLLKYLNEYEKWGFDTVNEQTVFFAFRVAKKLEEIKSKLKKGE